VVPYLYSIVFPKVIVIVMLQVIVMLHNLHV